jgi:hypothetical protein
MILAAWLSVRVFRSPALVAGTLLLCLGAVAVNLTLEKNPLVFPILGNGRVTIVRDGYQRTWTRDGSGSFSPGDKKELPCTGCGEARYTRLLKSEKYKVTGVVVETPEFSAPLVSLVTEAGQFPERDYRDGMNVAPDKAVERPFLRRLGNLMYYPAALFQLARTVETRMPGTPVLVEDDAGKITRGSLKSAVTDGRAIKPGSTIRLDCTRPLAFKDKKMCSLRFPDPEENTDFTIEVDAAGTPDSDLLVLR